MTPSLYIREASLVFDKQYIFKNINLTLPAGKWVALLGKSGAGKTSLLRLIAGLLPAGCRFSGNITSDNAKPLSHQMAYMAQTDLLLPWQTVLQNVMLGTHLRAESKKVRHQIKEKALLLLTQAGLGHFIHHYPHELSGGMRQRTALVRTLLEEKPIVLMDEPFSALDAITRYQLQALSAKLLRDKTVFFITHDPHEALRLAHEIYVLEPSGIRQLIKLNSETPRDLAHQDILHHQSALFHELGA